MTTWLELPGVVVHPIGYGFGQYLIGYGWWVHDQDCCECS